MDRLATEIAGTVYTLEDWKFLLDSIQYQFFQRTLKTAGYGIVATQDPVYFPTVAFNVTFDETLKQFLITPGDAFLPNGYYCSVSENVLLDPPTDSVEYYVLLVTVKSTTTPRMVRYGVSVNVREVYSPDIILIAASEYEASAYVGASLILARVQLDSATSQYMIDLTRTVVTNMRPWFIPRDYEHRSKVGTGVVSDTNAHGLSIADIPISGNLTFWDLLRTATVITNNRIHRHIIGDLYEERIPYTQLPGTTPPIIVDLELFPYRVYSVIGATSGTSYNFTYEARKRRLTIQSIITGGEDLIVQYSVAHVAMPQIDPVIPTKLICKGLVGSEIVIAEATAIATSLLIDTELDFRPYNYFPNDYIVCLTGAGQYKFFPTAAFGPIRATDVNVSAGPSTVNFELLRAASLQVGLYNSSLPEGGTSIVWQLDIELIGKDSDGASITETVTFTNLTWRWPRDSQEGVLAEQWVSTTHEFSILETVQITNAYEVPLNSVIAINYTPPLEKELLVAALQTRPRYLIIPTSLYDLRPVESLPMFKPVDIFDGEALILEYFSDPVYANIDYTEWVAETAWLIDGVYTSRAIKIRDATEDRFLDLYFLDVDPSGVIVEVKDSSLSTWTTLTPTRQTQQTLRYDLTSALVTQWVNIRITANKLCRLLGYVIKEG